MLQELRRFSKVAHRSFASRFSQCYVNDLLQKAGTFDDVGVLKAYVNGQCRHKRSGNPS